MECLSITPLQRAFSAASMKRQAETALSRESMVRPLISCKLEGAEVREQFYELYEAYLRSGGELSADDHLGCAIAPSGRILVQRNLYKI